MGEHTEGRSSWVTNTNDNFSTEKAFFEVLHIRCFPLPKKTGEVVRFENDVMVPDILADAVTISSDFSGVWGNGKEDSQGVVPIV